MPEKVSFHVVHASGQDENFRAAELNTHSPLTRGWSSSRFCLYPQDIVIQLERRCRLRKVQVLSHQYLIASRVEFFVGDIPQDLPINLQNARYTRLGYVALSDNEQTDYKARELKSVHVDAVGIYLKLVIHKNHVNKYNLYNQVGVIAINVIGDDLNKINADDDKIISTHQPDFISPLDDLAFDMYQDTEVAQIIRKLEKKKQDSVLDEKYDYAKRLKQAIVELQKVGERLGKYEVEKRQAVENEDYDKAKLKKVQMEEYRLQMYKQLEIHELLDEGASKGRDTKKSPRIEPPPSRLKEIPSPPIPRASVNRPSQPSPLPALQSSSEWKPAHRTSPRDLVVSTPRITAGEPPLRHPDPNDDRPIHGERNPDPNDDLPIHGDRRPDPNDDRPLHGERRPDPNDDRPLDVSTPQFPSDEPRLRHPDPNDDRPIHGAYTKEPVVNNSPSPRHVEAVDRDERALPSPRQGGYPTAEGDDEAGGQTDRSDAADNPGMTEKDMREAGFVIDIFGLPLVQKAYNRSWSQKEESMSDVVDALTEFNGEREEARAMMKAATFLLQRLLKDSVHPVFKATINSLKYLLTVFTPKHKIPKSDIHYTCEKTLPGIMHKTGDTAIRTRNEAKAQIIEMSQYPELRATHVVPLFCVRPFKMTVAPRLAQSHVEVVDELYTQLTSKDSGLTVDNLMKFCVNALQHHSGQVRLVSESLIIKLYKQHRSAVKSYLPSDDEKTRRNTLYRKLFEAFDQIDGKPSKKDLEKQRQADESAKRAEVEALQQQIADMKALSNNVAAQNAGGKKAAARKALIAAPQPEDDTISSITKFDRTCIFCNEQDDSFTEEGLDLHYWKSCPMLKRCVNCKQVVEIAGLTEHLLTECDAKATYSKCPRCSEAIPKTEFDEHVKAKACNPADPKKSHCPLCHLNITTGDSSWTHHLMSMAPDACKQNPRRIAAHNKAKNKAGGKAAPGVKGKAKAGRK